MLRPQASRAPIKTEPITSLSLSPDAWATTGHQDVTRPVAGCFPKGSGFYRVLIRPMRPWTIQSPSSLRYRSYPARKVFGGNQIYEISPLSTRRHLRHCAITRHKNDRSFTHLRPNPLRDIESGAVRQLVVHHIGGKRLCSMARRASGTDWLVWT